MKCDAIVVKASLDIVAPVFPFLAIFFAHVLLHIQQHVGIAYTHYQRASSIEHCVDHIWICYTLCWVSSASICI